MFKKLPKKIHLVSKSPWPLLSASCALAITFEMAMYFHGYMGGFTFIEQAFVQLFLGAGCWWRNVIVKSTFDNSHTTSVVVGLNWDIVLFIVSEFMFSYAFFWTFFYFILNHNTGCIAFEGETLYTYIQNPFDIPVLSTIILLSSSATLIWAHHSIILGTTYQAVGSPLFTIFLVILFTAWQGFEWLNVPFTINDYGYGSIFYLITGFHDFHVFVGTCFLVVCLCHLYFDHFGFEAPAWYWDFVNVVWLFLCVVFYLWGSF